MKTTKRITIFLSLLFITCFIVLSANAATKPAAPVLTSSNLATSGKISLEWNDVSGAEKYQIYRSNSKDGTFKLLKTTTSTSFSNTSVNAGETWYYYVVAVDASGNKSNRSNISSRTCDLPKPTITLSGIASSGKIKISWNAVEGAKEYGVYRATSQNGTYKLLKTTTDTQLTNTSTAAGTTYYYKVMAIHANSAANSAYSAVKSRTCDLAVPTNVKSSNLENSGAVQISWDPVEGASKYYIYRADSKDGEYKVVANSTGTYANNTSVTAGKTYYYKVMAVHSNTAANSALSGYTARTCDLPRPSITLSGIASSGKIKISWNAVEGAKEYSVYRATEENGTYKLLKTTTGTQLTNTSTAAGTTYYYKVMAIHANSAANSAYSTVKSRICDLASPVVTLSADQVTGKTVISWKPVDDAVNYQIYTSTSKNGSYTALRTISETSYIHKAAVAGDTIYYKVRALHSNTSAHSEFSTPKQKTCALAQPVIFVAGNSDGTVTVSWDAVDGAEAYAVYSASAMTGNFTLVDTTSGTSLVTNGKDAYFKVKALHSVSDADSAFSDAETAVYQLSAPQVSISKNDDGKPSLTWNEVDGAVEYEIWRSVTKHGTYSCISTTENTRFINLGANESVTYYYKVKAIAQNTELNSEYSDIVSITVGNSEEVFVTHYVKITSVNIYDEPYTESNTTLLKYMDEVQLGAVVSSSEEGQWIRVMYNNRLYYAWLPADDEKFTTEKSNFDYINDSNTELQNKILHLALKYLDLPTYYAHEQSTGIINPENGKYGFDCSGFAAYVHGTVMREYNPLFTISKNISILYETQTMYNNGYANQFDVQDVAIEDMLPGDVIFFKLDDLDDTDVNHCAIYLGNNEFIHATGYFDGVCILPLIDNYAENVVKVRRYNPGTMKPADQTIASNYSVVYLYAERDDSSERIYTFTEDETATLLYTSSNGNWGYVRLDDGTEGYVLMKRFDLVG